MCGIFGYIGDGDAASNIINGLKRLEYRGYDSWGVAVIDKGVKDSPLRASGDMLIKVVKKTGGIGDLTELTNLPESHIGIGHTRWATHGGVTQVNAHPHYSSDNSFVLAQNGIVENYQELKKMLIEKGYKFESETDTEVIVRLVEDKIKNSKLEIRNLKQAVREAFLELKGRNTIIVLSSTDNQVIAVKNGSPLVIGVGPSTGSGQVREHFFASDTLSFGDKTDKVIFMNNFEMAEYINDEVKLYDVNTDKEIEVEIQKLDHEDVSIDKEGYEHYMMKEIMEQKHTISESVSYSEEEFADIVQAVKDAETVFTLGAGGAFYAADQIAYLLRDIANVKTYGLRAYEVESQMSLIKDGDLIIVVSQSGETADNLEAIELIQKSGLKVKIASVVNMVGSTTTRISDFPFFSRSGPELCVLSTKSGSAEVAFGYLLAKSIIGQHDDARKSVSELTDYLAGYLSDDLISQAKDIASKIKDKEHLFLLGKGRNYQVATVGALNIKEASYLHAEAFTAGELKHGVIALIEEDTPLVCFVDNDEDRDYMIGATAEVKARGAYVIGIAAENNELFDDFIELPTVSGIDSAVIANILPCQLIAYYTAVMKGYNPDKPRNLAKSVTVK